MTILVTGGAGFIGSHLILSLLEGGHDVVCIDNINSYYDPNLKRARLAQFENRIVFYRVDITNRNAVNEVFKKHSFDKVCHLAAQAGVRHSLENPFIYADTNYIGTLNIFDAAVQNGVNHIIFASTSSIYGITKNIPFKEEDRVDSPVSIYAATKRSCELLASNYCYLHKDLNITCLRFFTVYGPFGRPDMALFRFTKAIIEGDSIDLYNNAEMRRDFTYVDDIVSGFILALEKPMGFEIFNLGRGKTVWLLDFVKILEKELNKVAKKNLLPMPPGDVPITYANTTKAKRELGFEAKVSVEEGVGRFVRWYKDYYKIGV